MGGDDVEVILFSDLFDFENFELGMVGDVLWWCGVNVDAMYGSSIDLVWW